MATKHNTFPLADARVTAKPATMAWTATATGTAITLGRDLGSAITKAVCPPDKDYRTLEVEEVDPAIVRQNTAVVRAAACLAIGCWPLDECLQVVVSGSPNGLSVTVFKAGT